MFSFLISCYLDGDEFMDAVLVPLDTNKRDRGVAPGFSSSGCCVRQGACTVQPLLSTSTEYKIHKTKRLKEYKTIIRMKNNHCSWEEIHYALPHRTLAAIVILRYKRHSNMHQSPHL